MLPTTRMVAASLLCVFVAAPAMRADTPDPLRLVPREADILVKVEDPAQIVKLGYNLKAFKDLQKIEAVQEAINSTEAKRFYQLIGYYEKELGASRFEIIDKIAGGGMVFALKAKKNPPVMFIVQGKDEKFTSKFIDVSLSVIQQELKRNQSKDTIKRGKFKGYDAVRIGDLRVLIMGATLIASNKDDAIVRAIELEKGKHKSIIGKANLVKARKKMKGGSLAWAWLDIQSLRRLPGSKEFFRFPQLQPILCLNFFPPIIEAAGRADYVIADFRYDTGGFQYGVYMPAGLKGMNKTVAAFFPKNHQGSLPLLEPKNVLASGCYFLDLAKLWKNRKRLLIEVGQLKQVEQFEKISGRFLGGVRLSQILSQSGTHYRVVATQPTSSVYKKRKPNQPFQAFGVVHRMRDKKFARTMNRMIRTVALFGAAGFDVKMVEEKIGDVTLVTYRFPENKEIAQDPMNIRYGFSPCFATVGDDFMVASTVELGRDLVRILQVEKPADPSSALMRNKFYSAGLASLLEQAREQIVTQFVLGQALPIEDAQKQTQALIDLVGSLGSAEFDTFWGDNEFRLKVAVDLTK